MAELIPPLNQFTLEHMTPGEKRVASLLHRMLDDECLIWYDIPVGNKRRYPDFIILHPAHGLLFLEVKDWKLQTLNAINKKTVELQTAAGSVTKPNPLEQVRQCAHVVLDNLSRDQVLQDTSRAHKGGLSLPYGWGVVFTNISRTQMQKAIPNDEDREHLMPDRLVLYKDDMTGNVDGDTLQAKLWGMFPYQFGPKLTNAQIDRIRWHLFPEIRIDHSGQTNLFTRADMQIQNLNATIPNIVKVMDVFQEQLARSLGEGHRVIHGVSGSGKTLILGYRCLHLAQSKSKPILVLCYNITLAAKLRALLATKGLGHAVQIHHFHEWCGLQLKTHHIKVGESEKEYFERQVESVIQGVEKGAIPKGQYGAILIDEGHDFEPEWLKLVVEMVDPETNALLLLYDDVQSIYKKSSSLGFTLASVGIQAQGRTTILRLNYRNTQEILRFAYEFAREYLAKKRKGSDDIPLVEPQAAGNSGNLPEFHKCRTVEEEVTLASDCISEWQRQGVPLQDMAVLYTENWQGKKLAERLKAEDIPHALLANKESKHTYNPSDEKVTVLSIHSSKGLEFTRVIILGVGHLSDEEEQQSPNVRLLYVGMTRAQEHLFITSSRENKYTRELLALAEAEAISLV